MHINKVSLVGLVAVFICSILALNPCKADFIYPQFFVEGNGSIQPQYGPYYPGQNLEIRGVPSTGWHFSYFKRNGVQVSPSYNPHLFLNLQSGENFTAVFEVGVVSHTLTIVVVGSGLTSPSAGAYSKAEGSIVVVTAYPASSFRLNTWLLDGVGVGSHNPYTVTIVKDTTLTAQFSYVSPPSTPNGGGPAKGGVDLSAFPGQLAEKLNIGLFPSQLLATAILLSIFLLPMLLLTRNIFAHLMVGLVIMGFCVAMSWMPYWLMLIVCMVTALLFSGKMRDWMSGGGVRGD